MYRFIAAVFFTALSLNTFALEANEWTMDFNTSSFHTSPTYANNKYYNEENNGFGFTYGYSEMLDVKVGYFENSYNKSSVYGGFVLNKDFYFLNNNLVVSPGMGLLLTTGYDDTPVDVPPVVPLLHPTISIGHRFVRSTIGYLPYGQDKVFTFQTQIMF